MHPLLNIALRAARSASKIIVRNLGCQDTYCITEKARNDFVTEIDQKAEAEIIKVIRKSYPDHAIMAEEGGAQGKNEYTWIIDPIDGTLNFLHGHPHFCIAIAIQHKQKILHGLIYDPMRDELFTASLGEGAFLNDKRIRVGASSKLDHATIGVSFSNRGAYDINDYFGIAQNVLPRVAAMRCSGSAALDLAYVAAGRLDGVVELNLKLWDIAAGTLIVRAAGGMVADLHGGDEYLKSGSVIASNPKLINALLKLLPKKS